MENKNRFYHIDFLRAVGIIGVMLTHVYSYNITNKLTFFIWNYLHFVVVAFVFCSGFVMIAQYGHLFTNIHNILSWYKKRILRLLIPFYIYLFFHYALWFLFPNFFTGLGLEKSPVFILKSILLIGGTNLNWLPLLFIQLALLFPLLLRLFPKRLLITSYVLFATFTTAFFTLEQFPYNYYRYIMWIPWSLIIILAVQIYYFEQKKIQIKKYIQIVCFSGLSFIILYLFFKNFNHSLTLIDNKYPPNFFYLSYATSITFLFLSISKTRIFQKKLVQIIYVYISKNAYSLFFIHYLVLDAALQLKKTMPIFLNPVTQSIFVISISLVISYAITRARDH